MMTKGDTPSWYFMNSLIMHVRITGFTDTKANKQLMFGHFQTNMAFHGHMTAKKLTQCVA